MLLMKTIVLAEQTARLFSDHCIPLTATDALLDCLIEQFHEDLAPTALNKSQEKSGPIKIHSLTLIFRLKSTPDEIVIEAEHYPYGKAKQDDCW